MVLLCLLATTRAAAQRAVPDVRVDARTELLMVLQTLGSATERLGLLTPLESPYRFDVLAYFEPFRTHEAVRCIDELAAGGFSFDAPHYWVLHHGDPPALEHRTEYHEYVLARARGRERLDRCMDAMRDFAVESDFMTFVRAHAGTYARMTAAPRELLSRSDDLEMLETYFGKRQASYTIILSPLGQGNFGPRIPADSSRFHIFSINGAFGVRGGVPEFATAQQLRYLLWHEFGHSYVNPLTDRHYDRLQGSASLFEPIAQKMGAQAYGQWMIAVNEHIVRAITARLHALSEGEAAGEALMLREQDDNGFAYIRPLYDRLRVYEADRQRWPALDPFYPQLFDVLDSIARGNL